MRIHYLQHVPFEGLGSIAPFLKKVGCQLTATRFFESVTFPLVDEIDGLIVLGGPMGVYDQSKFFWLSDEKSFIRSVIDSGKPVLGICLGAQLIASALGAKVSSNAYKEIGWFSVTGVSDNPKNYFSFPREFTAFHWHGDTFDLPEGAIRLAENKACKNQAFQMGRSVIGLQFHLETTPSSVRDLVENAFHELLPAKFVQSEEQILFVGKEMFHTVNRLMEQVLQYLFI